MNILLIDLHCDAAMPSGANEFGGGNTYSRGLLQQIIENKIFCLYITRKKYTHLNSSEQLSETCFLERIEIGLCNYNDKNMLQNYTEELVNAIDMLIVKYQLADFIIHSSYWQSGLVAMQLCKKYGKRLVHTVQSNGKKKQIVNSYQPQLQERIDAEQKIFDKAEYIICSSHAERNEIHELYNIPSHKLIFTGLPIDKSFIFPTQKKNGEILLRSLSTKTVESYLPTQLHNVDNNTWSWWINGSFLYFGRLSLDKGLYEIIKAWCKLWPKFSEKTPPLWIVGGIPDQINEIRSMLIAAGINIEFFEQHQKLIWWGTLSPSDLSCLLTKSMVTITHSKYESGGLTILESLASYTPVIATPHGYGKDYITDWYNGFIVEFGNIDLLEYRMGHFIMQPYLSDLMSKNARITFDTQINKHDFMQKHLEIYSHNVTEKQPNIIANPESCLNYPLLYNKIPCNEELLHEINSITKSNDCTILDDWQNHDSYTWIISSNNEKYRVDYWVNTVNLQRIWQDVGNYLTTSREKISRIISRQHINGCKSILFHSFEDRITICEVSAEPDFEDALKLLTCIFQNDSTSLEKMPSLDCQIKCLSKILSQNSKYINPNSLLKKLDRIRDINSKRKDMTLGTIPEGLLKSELFTDGLYSSKVLYRGEWGYVMAKLCLAYDTKAELNNPQLSESVDCWLKYLALEWEATNLLLK